MDGQIVSAAEEKACSRQWAMGNGSARGGCHCQSQKAGGAHLAVIGYCCRPPKATSLYFAVTVSLLSPILALRHCLGAYKYLKSSYRRLDDSSYTPQLSMPAISIA